MQTGCAGYASLELNSESLDVLSLTPYVSKYSNLVWNMTHTTIANMCTCLVSGFVGLGWSSTRLLHFRMDVVSFYQLFVSGELSKMMITNRVNLVSGENRFEKSKNWLDGKQLVTDQSNLTMLTTKFLSRLLLYYTSIPCPILHGNITLTKSDHDIHIKKKPNFPSNFALDKIIQIRFQCKCSTGRDICHLFSKKIN